MNKRDLNNEFADNTQRNYIYSIDRIIHRFIMRKFAVTGMPGNALEMGCFEGDFTELLLEYFSELTVVEGSSQLADKTRDRFDQQADQVKIVHSMFENYTPDAGFDNIFLVHGLEHLDDPVGALKRASSWLNPDGKLFVACPNANAPSRQIAVQMGLISHNSAVTEGERLHGHRCTYSLDTLERDVRAAGLNVISKGGVFFKGLANFQLDKALEAGVIDEQYLEGCYQLGDIYPNLCSSIFTICSTDTQ